MCDNNQDLFFDVKAAMKRANEEYEASRERSKLKRLERIANDFSINTSEKKIESYNRNRTLPDNQILYDKQNGLCPLCKLPLKSAVAGSTIDHIHPRSKGGSNDISNKQLTHSLCNNIKGDSTEYISPAQYRDMTSELKIKIAFKRKARVKSRTDNQLEKSFMQHQILNA